MCPVLPGPASEGQPGALFQGVFIASQGTQRGSGDRFARLAKDSPPDPDVKYSASHLLGVVLDALGPIRRGDALARQCQDAAAPNDEHGRAGTGYDKAARARRELLRR